LEVSVRNDMTEIGARLKELLAVRGETQADLARTLEVDESAVSRLMAGRRGLGAAELATLCEHFGVSSDFVLFGDAREPDCAVLLRAADDADAQRVITRVESAFADFRYVRALIGA
jgi:transcriptional regulator with XRE-family HTH domain